MDTVMVSWDDERGTGWRGALLLAAGLIVLAAGFVAAAVIA